MTSKSLVRLCVVGVAVIAGITAPQLPARAVVNLDNPALVTHVDSVENCPTNQARPISEANR
jgi:hypothetical protein